MKSEVRHQLEAPIDLARAQRNALLVAIIAVSATVGLPKSPLPWAWMDDWHEVIHVMLELATVAVPVHVMSMAWSGLSHSASAAANVLIFCLCVVAGVSRARKQRRTK